MIGPPARKPPWFWRNLAFFTPSRLLNQVFAFSQSRRPK